MPLQMQGGAITPPHLPDLRLPELAPGEASIPAEEVCSPHGCRGFTGPFPPPLWMSTIQLLGSVAYSEGHVNCGMCTTRACAKSGGVEGECPPRILLSPLLTAKPPEEGTKEEFLGGLRPPQPPLL